MIDKFTIQRIKDAASIVEVIGEYYELRKKGSHYECLCPFHQDRHLGSFTISPRRNTFRCWACGEEGNAIDFIMKMENLTFPQALARVGRKYGIEVEGDVPQTLKPLKPCKPHQPLPELPMLVIPTSMVKAKMPDVEQDRLVMWLRSLPWNAQQRVRIGLMLRYYGIGRSREGHTIFWQIDEKARVRTGKLMLYKPDGHRDKESKGNFGWIHSRLFRAGMMDEEKVEMRQCLFGMHLIDFTKAKQVNIVESEKTALICAIAYGHIKDTLWMASGGKTQLTQEKLQPLIDRKCHINLFPDHDALEEWQEIAKGINYFRLHVDTRFMAEYWREEDGPKADIADVIVRMLQANPADADKELGERTGEEMLGEVIKRHPAVKELVDALDLQPVNNETQDN